MFTNLSCVFCFILIYEIHEEEPESINRHRGKLQKIHTNNISVAITREFGKLNNSPSPNLFRYKGQLFSTCQTLMLMCRGKKRLNGFAPFNVRYPKKGFRGKMTGLNINNNHIF